MQLLNKRIDKKHWVYLYLLIATLVVYWPLSFNILSLKNDAVIYFLPYRFHISEAIQNGHFPFWNPYIYTGYPLHADMQSGVWNPFVLLLSCFWRYNMSVLQWEVLFYFYLAAVGMFRLIKSFDLSASTAFCGAISFLCCGYITDSVSVILWISSAAFIPFVLLYFTKLIKSPIFSNAIKLALSLSLLFLCGYPSFFIFLNYILLFVFAAWLVYQFRRDEKHSLTKTILYLISSYALFLMICSAAIISYYEFLPYYSRGEGLSYARSVTNSLAPASLLSYIIANAISKASFFAADIGMRNSYVGLFMFLLFLMSLFQLNRTKKIILALSLICFLFSLGHNTPIQKFFYDFLPLMDTFRHPATMRVFTSIGIILLACFSLEQILKNGNRRRLLILSFTTLTILLLSLIYIFVFGPDEQTGFIFSFDPASLKENLYKLSFHKFSAFILTLQLLFIIVFISVLVRNKFSKKAFITLLVLNSIIFGWMGLPFTVVSQYTTDEVNHYLNSFPSGYPGNILNTPVETGKMDDPARITLHGYTDFYTKKITIQDHVFIPALNKDYESFLANKPLREKLRGYPFAYVKDNDSNYIDTAIKEFTFTSNSFVFHVSSPIEGRLFLFQQYHHNWKVRVNHQLTAVEKANVAFMSVRIPAGASVVEWKYRPVKVYTAIIVSLITLCGILAYFVVQSILKKKPHA